MLSNQYIRAVRLDRSRISHKNTYPFNLSFIEFFDQLEMHKNVTFLIGENGSGKSTLLEAIAVNYGFNAEGGSKNFNFSTKETHSTLSNFIRISKGVKTPKDGYFLRAESFYNVATNIDDINQEDPGILNSYGGKSLHEQSHGESFFSLFKNRCFGNGIYLLDEPEAALSPQRQFAFLVRMNELVKQNSQFVIVTHSPIILAYPDAKIIQISENGFEELTYKQTDYYTLYKTFLDNPDYFIKQLQI